MIIQSAVIDRLKYLLKTPPTQTPSLSPAAVYSHARENLADTVAPFRWSDEQLAEFVNGGTEELKNMRSDVALLDNVPASFEPAVTNYCVYRALALDNDAQNNNGALSDKYLNLFISQTKAVPYFFTEEQLGRFADDTVTDIISKRPELRISADGTIKENIKTADGWDMPERFTDAVVSGAAGRAAAHSRDDSASYFFDQYNGALRTI